FAGVVLLVSGRSASDSHSSSLWAALAVVVAGVLWAAGSLYSKYSPNHGSPWMNAAAQMVCGGAGLLVVALVLGEPFRADWSVISTRSVIAELYLIVFGSWIGFTAYVWLLRVTSASRVSTYAYVNPVIAVFLGWAVLGETVSGRMLWGALVVLAGVVIITLPRESLGKLRDRWKRLSPFRAYWPGSTLTVSGRKPGKSSRLLR
ncbi:MAG: EamA family transporter, partial [Limisphaerales bacterium]